MRKVNLVKLITQNLIDGENTSTSYSHTLIDSPFEIKDVFKNLNNRKSPGFNNFHPEKLNVIFDFITKILRQVLPPMLGKENKYLNNRKVRTHSGSCSEEETSGFCVMEFHASTASKYFESL